MAKVNLEASTALYPLPAVMVSCRDKGGRENITTVAWTGIICSDPPMLYISLRPGRFSNRIIKESMEFVVNIPSRDMLKELDYCGVRTGRHVDKFGKLNIVKEEAAKVGAPLISGCPINIECRVKQIMPLGSHDMFISDIVAVDVDENIVKDGKINYDKIDLIPYIGVEYYGIGELLAKQGFSVKSGA